MPLETLDFEEPIAIVLKEIDALAQLPRTDARDREIASLQRRLESVRSQVYTSLTPWQRVLVARHPARPGLEDFIQRLFTGFTLAGVGSQLTVVAIGLQVYRLTGSSFSVGLGSTLSNTS